MARRHLGKRLSLGTTACRRFPLTKVPVWLCVMPTQNRGGVRLVWHELHALGSHHTRARDRPRVQRAVQDHQLHRDPGASLRAVYDSDPQP